MVVDAVNKCDKLAFHFPSDHDVQNQIAAGFKACSDPGFDNCVGAIDGMLLWLEKPTEADCEIAKCPPKRFFCGRKHKFGLNFQGVCDSKGRFLDIACGSPASTSDFLAFTLSSIFRKLEDMESHFLAPGLCLYGDAAYVNNRYMAVPFKSVGSGSKFHYNHFQSQLHIKIECAFGMLVNCWGILRRALPSAFGLRKTNSLMMCLCRLHNFCLDENSQSKDIAKPLATDAAEIRSYGGVNTVRTEGNPQSPEAYLHAGAHHRDTSGQARQAFSRRGLGRKGKAPRDIMLKIIEDGGFQRPTPKHWE